MWAYAKAITLIGPVGSGQLTKMVNQLCLSGLTQSLAEALNFADRAGLDAEKVLGVISKGAAQSWMMDNRSQTMLADQFDFGFAVDWMRKDLKHRPGRGARGWASACRSRPSSTSSWPRCSARAATAGITPA